MKKIIRGAVLAAVAFAFATPASALMFISVSTTGNNPVPGVASGDNANLYLWDGSEFTGLLDASVNGLPGPANIDGVSIVDGNTFYLSFASDTTLPGLGTVSDEDIVLYNAGSFSSFFDGSDFGLDVNNGQDIDAFDVVDDTLYFSTAGGSLFSNPDNGQVPGVDGPYDDADIYTWNLVDGFDRLVDAVPAAGFAGGANIDGLSVVDNDTYYVSFSAENTSVPGLAPVNDQDILLFDAGVWSVYFDGSAAGLTSNAQDVDAFDVSDETVLVPEPGTLLLTGLGFVGLGFTGRLWRRRNR